MSEGVYARRSHKVKAAYAALEDKGRKLAAAEDRIRALEAENAELKAERRARHWVHKDISCAEAERRFKKAVARAEKAEAFHEEVAKRIGLPGSHDDEFLLAVLQDDIDDAIKLRGARP